MDATTETLLALGMILLLGLASDYLGRHTFMPRVTLLLAAGILVGEQGLNLIPLVLSQRFDIIANLALLMIGFLLGGQLTLPALRDLGRPLLWISVCAALATTVLVALLLWLVGVPVDIAILLGCIAAATAPAATTDTVIESGVDSGFSRLLLAIVASSRSTIFGPCCCSVSASRLLHSSMVTRTSVQHCCTRVGKSVER